jgi:hypothetical protein
MISVQGKMGTVPDKAHPGQRIVLDNMFHDSAVHHFKGRILGEVIERKNAWSGIRVNISGYVFEGSVYQPLKFRCVLGKGYVYAGGVGKVILKDGKEVALGKENPQHDSQTSGKVSIAPTAPDESQTANLIANMATLKLVMIDIFYKSLGIVWPDNASWDVLRTNAMRLLARYGKKSDDIDGSLHPKNVHGMLSHDPYIAIKLPQDWAEIYQFNNPGTLPKVKFKNGTITLKLKDGTMVPSFSDGTECLLDVTHYRYVAKENRWEKSGEQK